MSNTDDRKKEIYLAKRNGCIERLYSRDVKHGVKKEKELPDEVAILRKMVKALFDKAFHGIEIPDKVIAEFEAYNSSVETIKSTLRAELGMEVNECN